MKRKAKWRRISACMMALLLTLGGIGQNAAVAFAQETASEQQETEQATQQSEAVANVEMQAAPETAPAEAPEAAEAPAPAETSKAAETPAPAEMPETASTETLTAPASEAETQVETGAGPEKPSSDRPAAEETETAETGEETSVTITFIIGEGEGTLSASELTLSATDKVKTVRATPAEGYVFSGWTKTGDEIFSEASDAFTPAKENAEYAAHFTVAESEEESEKAYNAQPIEGSETADGVTVSVSAPEGSFPEGTTLTILPISRSEAEALVSDMDASAAVAFDITFKDADGNKVQPQDGKNVSVTFSVSGSSDLAAPDDEEGELQIIHVGDEGKEQLGSVTAPENGGSAEVHVNADSFSPFVAVLKVPNRAPAAPKEVEATVTQLTIQNLKGEEVDKVYWTDKFYLAMDWDASANGADLHAGDYFDIILPEKMVFPSDSASTDFNIYAEDGTTVIATAHVTPGADNKGGTVRITFNDWVEGKENVKGNIRLAARFDRQQVVTGEENTFQIEVGSQVVPVTVTVTGPKELESEILAKWGQSAANANEAEWYVRINHQKASLTNVVISDHLSEGTSSETYLADSFTLLRVEMDIYGNATTIYETIDVTDKLTIAPDGRSFILNLGNVNGDQYRLIYRTTYTPGTTLRNNMSLTSTEQSKTTSATHISADSGGSGTGNLANKIKLIKVDEEDQTIVLAGARFEVTAPDGSTFELVTGADGTVTSGALTSGIYKVKEKTAPVGYELNGSEFTLTVSPAGGAIQTITDKRIRLSIEVTKAWEDGNNQDGKRPESVTVQLRQNGEPYGAPEQLSEDNGWSKQFTELPKYADDGTEYHYTVSEVPVDGYTSVVTGSAEGGFTVTNTHTPETVTLHGAKTWDDNNNQDGLRPDRITIRLSDGTTEQVREVTAADNWEWSFEGLPKYKDGQEITYTITEDGVPGYTTAIDGYNVTNTHVPETVSINGSKTWDDNENQDGIRPETITIRLLANGTEKETAVVDADSDWSWKFENLPKYENGAEILYTITEDVVEDYTSEVEDYSVTNVHTPGKTSVTVTKSWDDQENQDGIRPEKVIIHLLANGEDTGKMLELSAENNWTDSFKDLDEKQNGQKIVYTVSEETVTGYENPAVSGDAAAGFVVTNAHKPETVEISGEKTWEDADNQDGVRPESITIRLLADGIEKDRKTVTAADGWSWKFSSLAKYRGGVEIKYTITEDAVEEYTSRIEGYDVINQHMPGKTSISVTKSWDDKEDQDGLRADSVTIHLFADGADTGKTLVLKAANNWTGSFTDLDEKSGGKAIVYTVKEDEVPGYTVTITGNQIKGFTVTNVHTPKKPTPPDKPNPPRQSGTSPKTGDESNLMLWAFVMAASLFFLTLSLIYLRRRLADKKN